VCKDENEYPKLPMDMTTLPHYKGLSSLPDDNINLRQKIIPTEETTRNNVYKVCWSDLLKKKQPNRHFSNDECRGWKCRVSGDTCGGTPEKPMFTCVNQPNPGLCTDSPCWFGVDGSRYKEDGVLGEDPKFSKSVDDGPCQTTKGDIKYMNYNVSEQNTVEKCCQECKKDKKCNGFTWEPDTKRCNMKTMSVPDKGGRQFVITPGGKHESKIFKKTEGNDAMEVSSNTSKMKLSKCPDDWNFIGNNRCEAEGSNRGKCESVMSFSGYTDDKKRKWAKKCNVIWTDMVMVNSEKTPKDYVDPDDPSAGVEEDSDLNSAVIYSKENFTGDEMEIPMGGGHCPDMEDQDPDILWEFEKESRVCENPMGKTFSGKNFGSVKLHPDYQITVWKDEKFKKGGAGVSPVSTKISTKDSQFDLLPAYSYVVCKKSSAGKEGHCKKPNF